MFEKVSTTENDRGYSILELKKKKLIKKRILERLEGGIFPRSYTVEDYFYCSTDEKLMVFLQLTS